MTAAAPEASPTPVLQTSGLSKSYGEGDARVDALVDVNLTVHAGEMVAIMGTSGSGKSTLLSIAGGLLVPTSGQVSISGAPLALAAPRELARLRRERVGFVFQDFNLIPSLSVIENVALPLDLNGAHRSDARSAALRALESVEMADRADAFVDDLSGGQRQRVAIARAIVGERTLLLADEPTGALDSVTGDHVLAGLSARADAGAAVVLVTHDARHAAWADRIIYLRDGRIVDETTASSPEQLLHGGAH